MHTFSSAEPLQKRFRVAYLEQHREQNRVLHKAISALDRGQWNSCYLILSLIHELQVLRVAQVGQPGSPHVETKQIYLKRTLDFFSGRGTGGKPLNWLSSETYSYSSSDLLFYCWELLPGYRCLPHSLKLDSLESS